MTTWDTKAIAEALGLQPDTVRKKLRQKGAPKPVIATSQKHRRWNPADVLRWAGRGAS